MPFRQKHDPSEFTPLRTSDLLQLAGILPAGTAGAEAWRSDRGVHRVWNDRWGNPLVAVAAVFAAARYEPQDQETWHAMRGGRDWLKQRAEEVYGFSCAVYVSVGAVGPRRVGTAGVSAPAEWDGETPLIPWTAADDAAVTRQLWLQISDVCQAQDVNETSFDAKASTGVRDRSRGRLRCLLTTPIVIADR